MSAAAASPSNAPSCGRDPLPLFWREPARRFLNHLFTDVPGLIEVRTLGTAPGDRPEQTFAHNIDDALDAAEDAALRRRNVYAGVATRDRADVPRPGSKANLRAVRCWWLDADFHADGDLDPDAAVIGGRELLEVQLESFPSLPTLRVWSGGGLHLYWRRPEALDLRDPAAIEKFEALLRGAADFFHGDRAATDASRVLRVPGTWNLPNARKRALGRDDAACLLLDVHDARGDTG